MQQTYFRITARQLVPWESASDTSSYGVVAVSIHEAMRMFLEIYPGAVITHVNASGSVDIYAAQAYEAERDTAIMMLAEWCVAVEVNGTGWGAWGEHCKNALYRASPLRELLDGAIAKAREAR